MNDAIGRRGARQRGSLPRSVPSRAIAASAVGMAVTASTLLGAGTASASERVVVDKSLASVEVSPGQQIAVQPSTMDTKVREAVLLAMPLDFDAASQATEQFREGSPIILGTASEGKTSFSGADIAKAAAPELSGIGLPDDKVEDVSEHFQRLVKLGNHVTARAKEAAPPKQPPRSDQPSERPSERPSDQPSDQPRSEQPPAERPSDEPSSEQPSSEPAPPQSRAPAPSPEPPSVPLASPTSAPRLTYGAPAPVRVLPPDPAQVPGFLPPFAQSGAPQQPPKPELGNPRSAQPRPEQQQRADQQRQADQERQEVRAAGKVEALPEERSNRVEVPVLLGAISVAAVTAALVRSWILRRN